MHTRDEFEKIRQHAAKVMADDEALQKSAINVLNHADQHMWLHQTTWLGEPSLQLPQDLFAVQEIIYNTRPKFIIECGVCWGGSILFYATLLEILGLDTKIIGIDVFIPPDLRERLRKYEFLTKRLTLINASSVAPETVAQVKKLVGESREVMVNLDSNHTHAHVLAELKNYSPFVGKGQYLICADTFVEYIPPQIHRPREWGPGNSPMTALNEFLAENKRFESDVALQNKLLLTCNPLGYLKCVS